LGDGAGHALAEMTCFSVWVMVLVMHLAEMTCFFLWAMVLAMHWPG
jgi:hypothetical protein